MSAVLDTHTVLWYLENSQELSSVARTAIEDAVRTVRDVHVSPLISTAPHNDRLVKDVAPPT